MRSLNISYKVYMHVKFSSLKEGVAFVGGSVGLVVIAAGVHCCVHGPYQHNHVVWGVRQGQEIRLVGVYS